MKNFYKTFTLTVAFLLGITFQGFSTTHYVNTEDFEFNPAIILNVTVGDTITWFWDSGFHTTTSTNTPSGAAPWSAPIDQTNQTFTYVITVAGSYDYQCDYHYTVGMVGHFIANMATSISSTTPKFPFSVRAISGEQITIDYEGAVSGWNVELLSLTGAVVKNLNDDSLPIKGTVNYFIGDLPRGIYILRIFSHDQLYASRIIRQ